MNIHFTQSSARVSRLDIRATRASYTSPHNVENSLPHCMMIIGAIRRMPPIDKAVDIAKRNLHSLFSQPEEIVQVLPKLQAFVKPVDPLQNASAE